MLEGGLPLSVRVGDFAVVLPFAEQEALAARFGELAEEVLQVALFHGQDEIRGLQQFRRQLASLMLVRLLAMTLQGGQGVGFDGVADHGGEAGGADTDVCASQAAPEQMLCCRAAADVACADNQDVFEHADHRCFD